MLVPASGKVRLTCTRFIIIGGFADDGKNTAFGIQRPVVIDDNFAIIKPFKMALNNIGGCESSKGNRKEKERDGKDELSCSFFHIFNLF